MQKDVSFFKTVGAQVTAILIAALGAAAITFFQSLASSSGMCPMTAPDPAQAGTLGALLKSFHSALMITRGTMHS